MTAKADNTMSGQANGAGKQGRAVYGLAGGGQGRAASSSAVTGGQDEAALP